MIGNKGNELDFMYCLCEGTYVNVSDRSTPLLCKICDKLSHRECVCYSGPDDDFECSLCRVQLLDPFNNVVEFLWYGRMCNKSTAFKIDVPNLDKWLSSNKDVYVVSLPLSKSKLMHEWPKRFELKVNNEVVHVVKEPNWEHPRRDNPIKITYAMHAGENLIEVFSTTYNEFGPPFLVIFMLSKQVTVERMIETIKKRRTIHLNDSKQRVVELINNQRDDDDVICLEPNHKMELTCPITMYRIELPARGKKCKHLQCFDLSGYLQVMQNTSTFNARWKCPECQLILKPMDLVIDGYVLDILEATPQRISTVEFDTDGNYKLIERENPWDDLEYHADLEAFNNAGSTSSKSESSSPYSTSVLSEQRMASSSADCKFNPQLKEGVHVKREQGCSSIATCVIELDSGDECTTTTKMAPLGFKNGEVISLDSSDEDDDRDNCTASMRGSPSDGGTSVMGVNSPICAVPSKGRGTSKNRPQGAGGHTEVPKDNARGPSMTLSQRLTQLPRIAEAPRSAQNGLLKNPLSHNAARTQRFDVAYTTKADSSLPLIKSPSGMVKLTKQQAPSFFSSKDVPFFK